MSRLSALRLSALLLLSLSTVGCFSGSESGDSTSDAAVDAETGACQEECELGHVCVDGSCEVTEYLSVRWYEREYEGEVDQAGVHAQFFVPVAGSGSGYMRLDGVGLCEARQATEPAWELQDRDVGTLRVEVIGGSAELPVYGGGDWEPVLLGRAFAIGEEVASMGSGGTDIGAFSETLLFPPPINGNVPEIEPGQPALLSWDPRSDGTVKILMRGMSNDYVSCEVPAASGQVEVDGALTSYLYVNGPVNISHTRRKQITTDTGGIVEIRASRIHTTYSYY